MPRGMGYDDGNRGPAVGPGLWERLETPGPVTPTRALDWRDYGSAEYVYTERIREALPDDQSTYDYLNTLGTWLIERRGHGFGYTTRTNTGQPTGPAWLNVHDQAVDPASGRIVLAGYPTHASFGLPPALDLGAIDGRNLVTFKDAEGRQIGLVAPNEQVYVGSLRTGTLVPYSFGREARSVDLDPHTGVAAVLSGYSGQGVVWLIEADGTRRSLTELPDLVGNETIRFSPDGTWLLVSTWRHTHLVATDTGRWVTLDFGNACWRPGHDSQLLMLTIEGDKVVPAAYNLEQGAIIDRFPALDFGAIEAGPVEPGLYAEMSNNISARAPVASPDGSRILVETIAGVTDAYRSEHGSGHRLVEVDLSTGRVSPPREVFVSDGKILESDQTRPRWLHAAPASRVVLGSNLLATAQEPMLDRSADWDVDGADGKQTGWFALDHLTDHLDQPPGRLMPEALLGLATARRDSEEWLRVEPAVDYITQFLAWKLFIGNVRGQHETEWQRLLFELEYIQHTPHPAPDVADLAWTLPPT